MLHVAMKSMLILHVTIIIASTCQACDYHLNTTKIGKASCSDSRTSEGNVLVNCRLGTLTQLGSLISCPGIVHSLDVSMNGIAKIEDNVFYRYNKLVNLNLSYNSISYIKQNAFKGLTNLVLLDLSYNSLYTWNEFHITKQLPSLKELNVIENPAWLPGQHIRDLPNITVIKGIASYSKPYLVNSCVYCNLYKSTGFVHKEVLSIDGRCFKTHVSFSKNISAIWHPKFSIVCKIEYDTYACEQTRFINRKFSHFTTKSSDLCFQEINNWEMPSILIGLIAMIINTIVMVTVMLTPRLLKKANMLLIAKLALGDFLQGLWLLILTITRLSMTSIDFFEIKMPVLCYSLFAIYLTSQALSVSASFLVTIERYLCIVYSTKPHIRLTRRSVIFLILLAWLCIVIIAIIPISTRMQQPPGDYSCMIFILGDGTSYILYLGICIAIAYSTSYMLYARIFYTVRKSSLNVGIQREGKLAKRIIVVLSTNLLFVYVPILAGQVLLKINGITWVMKNICWNAIFLWFMGINSCINPFLFAFRIEIFRASFKRIFKCGANEISAEASPNC